MNSSDEDTSPAEDSREGVSEERERIVSLKNLRKVFLSNGKQKVAVDGVSLDMFEGEICAFLDTMVRARRQRFRC